MGLVFADERASPGRDRKDFPRQASVPIGYVKNAIDFALKVCERRAFESWKLNFRLDKKTSDYVWQV